jgi:periplasmic divalent cation tolerance protein
MLVENDPSEFCIVYCTVPDTATADNITDHLIKEKLAACVHRSEAGMSVYRWQGKICREKELVLTIKTKVSLYLEVESAIKKHHPYDVPEIIACPMISANFQYLDWLEENTR